MEFVKLLLLFLRGKVIFACGHSSSLRGQVREGEHDLSWNLILTPWKAAGSVCVRCAIAASIDCCSCPGKIYPGDPVALYGLRSEGIDWERATRVVESVVGCLRWNCCPCGGFYAGNWTTDGFQGHNFASHAA
ncbi:MAG: hypothetical protein A2Z11_02920 [Candidatus Woykebacteria bacterium RBG_16_43_9]|uniref:Uncharacterized protein n=1 Tax=Candidatus Woykebacteria bacterium RBG_16_43_9 TaxID=1802596 RepID=A0A1G1WCD7_9BACT|nr:MAG: hypothetical protein A2Z11_02920 [Candidatus Woykebacteria bacterium RBG_16_43_9]